MGRSSNTGEWRSMPVRFDGDTMELLKAGHKAAEDAVVVAVFEHFEGLCRTVCRMTNCGLDPHECEDVAQEFIAERLPKLIRNYRGCDAKEFSKLFYASLRNFSLDWLRKVVFSKTGKGSQISVDAPLPGGDATLGDFLPAENPLKDKLLPGEFDSLISDIREAMLLHVSGDEMKAWILEASLMAGMKAEEIERRVPELFPCKVFASGSVYSLVSRFRSSAELAAVAKRWMVGEAWARMR